MKKTILTFSLLALSIWGFGQGLEIGLKAGANFANASTDLSGVDAESITALHGGAYALLKVSKLGIQPELLFSKQGSDLDGNQIDLTYVNIPVMLKMYVAAGLNLQAGPQFGILTNAEDDDGDIKSTLKGSDLSAAFGVGWDAPFGLQFGARYVLGLGDINDETGGAELKNRTFQLYVGYSLFKLGK